MNRQLAFVLGGGGARGALQAGAIKALVEAGAQPDLLVGTSIGAVNAAFLALHGANLQGVGQLIQAWRDSTQADLLPSNYLWLTVRALFGRPIESPVNRMREFFITHGMTADLKFGDLGDRQLIIVAADLNKGVPVLYGSNPDDSVLQALIASTALPPWVQPLHMNERLLIDGGVVSNLPIEPALAHGVREIVAMNLVDFRDVLSATHGFGPFLGKLFNTVEQRQLALEMALAKAQGVPVYCLNLLGKEHVPLWDFTQSNELIETGYETACKELEEGVLRPLIHKPGWLERMRQKIISGLRRSGKE
jgi:NTE family protein